MLDKFRVSGKFDDVNRPSALIAMVLVLLMTFAFGANGLNADVIWYDELTSVGHAGGLTGPFSPVDVIDSIRTYSPKHAPLFFELLSGWGNTLGWHQVTLRVLSLYFGVLTIAWVYRIGKDFDSFRVGFWSALFLGLNVFWLEYYHEVRMYTLQIALVMTMLWHYLYITSSRGVVRWYHWLGLIFSATASLYTQPFSFFVHIAIGLYHLLFISKNRQWFNITFSFLFVGILYLVWFPVTYVGLTTKFDTSGDAMVLQQALEVFVRLFSNGAWFILVIPIAIAIMQLRNPQHRQRAKFIWILAILILGLLLFTNEVLGLIPLRRARYFFVSWGVWSLVIGIGLAYIRYQWISCALVVLFVASGFALRSYADYQLFQGTISAVNFYPPMQNYVEELRNKVGPLDFVVGFTDADFVNRRGKHGKSTSDYYMEVQLGIDGAFIPSKFSEEELYIDIPIKLGTYPDLLLTYHPNDLPENFDTAIQIIEDNYSPCDVLIDRDDLFIRRYVDSVLDCNRDHSPIHYDNGIKILDKYIDYAPEENILHVITAWQVKDERLLDEYNVSIQIVTPDWQNVGQTDRHLYDDILTWYRAELPTEELMSGDYRVMVIVYDRETGEKVQGTDILTGETGTILPLAVFNVDS